MLHGARPDDGARHRRVVDHPRDRDLDQRDAGLVGEYAQLVGGLELALVAGQAEVIAAREALRPRGGRRVLALAVFAAQPAARQRAPRDHADAVALAGGEDVGLDPAHEHAVRRLLGLEALEAAVARDPLRLDDLRRGERRGAEVADLARPDEVGERRERLLDVGVLARAVDLVEVDVVGPQAAERVLDLRHDPAPRAALVVDLVAHLAVELRGEDDVVAAAFEGLADDLLVLALAVDVRGVDEVDACVERGVDDLDRVVVVRVAPRAEHHRAEAQRADLDAGPTEVAVLHPANLPPARGRAVPAWPPGRRRSPSATRRRRSRDGTA